MRTRFFVALFAMMALFVGQEAFGKTRLPIATMQGALNGSVKRAVALTLVKPVTSPLARWARAAAEKARTERQTRLRMQVQTAGEDDSLFSRDRD